MQQNTREPKQKRAIEKKESLIKAAFELFSEKGFYNTNSKEISKKAGVSIGLFYNYFNDKSDVFLEIFNKVSYEKYIKLNNIIEKLITDNIENDKKQILKVFLNENIELLAKLAFIYKDIETISKEYIDISEAREKYKLESKNLVTDFLIRINRKANIENLHIKCEVIITTIDANCILISKLESDDDKEKYIDEIVYLIYDYMF